MTSWTTRENAVFSVFTVSAKIEGSSSPNIPEFNAARPNSPELNATRPNISELNATRPNIPEPRADLT